VTVVPPCPDGCMRTGSSQESIERFAARLIRSLHGWRMRHRRVSDDRVRLGLAVFCRGLLRHEAFLRYDQRVYSWCASRGVDPAGAPASAIPHLAVDLRSPVDTIPPDLRVVVTDVVMDLPYGNGQTYSPVLALRATSEGATNCRLPASPIVMGPPIPVAEKMRPSAGPRPGVPSRCAASHRMIGCLPWAPRCLPATSPGPGRAVPTQQDGRFWHREPSAGFVRRILVLPL